MPIRKSIRHQKIQNKGVGTASLSSSSSSKWGPVPFKVHVYFSNQTEPVKIPALSITEPIKILARSEK